MASTDISRINFDPAKHYASVRMQQGRVLTDDDWNENERIDGEDERQTNIDIIGPYGTPDDGFLLEALPAAPLLNSGGNIDFQLHAGTIYLGGIRVKMESDESYRLQKDWLQQPAESILNGQGNNVSRYDLAYLEVWQQAVTAVEDESLFEVALAGADTTTRIRTMRRVHLLKNIGVDDCAGAWKIAAKQLGVNKDYERVTDARLKVGFGTGGLPQNLCTPSVAGGYLGAENQAIRVQLTDANHFTWGFDNASPLYRATITDGKTVKLLTEPKDQYHWPLSNRIVEILAWSAVLANGEKVAEEAGHLSKIAASYNPDSGEFTMATPLPAGFGSQWKSRPDKGDLSKQTPGEYFYVRLWDRGDDLTSDAAIAITAAPMALGHTGLEVNITGGSRYQGDYWVIAARPETPNRVVPWSLEQSRASHGVKRYFAPLGILSWQAIQNNMYGYITSDCRIPFDALTGKQETCIVAVPGPGWEKVFNRFKPGQDVCVCFKNGIYELKKPVALSFMGNIKFTGCGKGSQIIVQNQEAAFSFSGCKDILIRDLSIANKAVGQIGYDTNFVENLTGIVSAYDCENIIFENITVTCVALSTQNIRQNTCITISGQAKVDKKAAAAEKEQLAAAQKAQAAGLPQEKSTKEGSASAPVKVSKKPSTRATIINSKFVIDTGQTGLLLIDTFKSTIDGCTINSAKVGNQGIVIAGTRPKNINIANNIITNLLQGIHIGVSNNKRDRDLTEKQLAAKEPDMVGTVIITGNSVECMLLKTERRERHGIFVGNCESLIITDNYLKLVQPDSGNTKPEADKPSRGIIVDQAAAPTTKTDIALTKKDTVAKRINLEKGVAAQTPVEKENGETAKKMDATGREIKEEAPQRVEKMIVTNYQQVQRYAPMNGIRLYGFYGKRIIVRDNHLEGFEYRPLAKNKRILNTKNYGIYIHYLNVPDMAKWWVVEANITGQMRIEGPGRQFRTAKMTFADRWRKNI